jgi:hypothetical protein
MTKNKPKTRAADPEAVLRQIAGDETAPATARVAACRTLLVLAGDPVAQMRAEKRVRQRPTKKALDAAAADKAIEGTVWETLIN